ncbi:laminarinase [Mycena sp. CBHHK59/15]|nr:laminarinase [Mycena sp. CBHHK59/15]
MFPLSAIFGSLSLLSLAPLALGVAYKQTDNISGAGFLSAFSYQAISDPTHGRVNYINAATAASQNLTFASGNTFILRADSKTVLSASGLGIAFSNSNRRVNSVLEGRNSVRLQSNKQFTTAVTIFDVRHMPQGCGTWPALWTVGANWPNQGEIDILEGVNDQGPNQATLHTNAGCTMPASRTQTGTSTGNNCDVAATNNAGCGVKLSDSKSYGPTFNSNGGGWYAVERTNAFIKVWFWSRNAGTVPSDISSGSTSVNTDNWGTPVANFPSTTCPISSKFGPHNIIINLTFCGDWAGQTSVYAASGCPSTCVDFVNNNPSSFSNAYFDFASLRIFQ